MDVEFVRRSIRAIGKCALKVDVAAERCVSTLLDLIQTKVNYVVQEAIIVIKVSSPLLCYNHICIYMYMLYHKYTCASICTCS